MNNSNSQQSVQQIINDALVAIAPDVDPADINPEANLRDECGIDSMDFLHILIEIKNRCGVEIPETDYAKVDSYNRLADYLSHNIGASTK